MSFPMCTVGQRFQGMAVKDNSVRLGIPASDRSILDQFQHAVFIDPGLEHDKLTAKDLEKATFSNHSCKLIAMSHTTCFK